jgi:hypothetical protein
LEALDAVELRPPPARPPAGLETSELWGTRRATDCRALERLVGVGGSRRGRSSSTSGGGDTSTSNSGGGEQLDGGDGGEEEEESPVLLGADGEVLRRLARRVSAARRVLASDDIGGGGGGVLDSHAADVAAAQLASRGRSELVGVPFDELPDGERNVVQRAVAEAIGDRHVSPRVMRRLLLPLPPKQTYRSWLINCR